MISLINLLGTMKFAVVVLALIAVAYAAPLPPTIREDPAATHAYLTNIVKQINSNPQSTWVAEVPPRFANLSLASIARLCGALQGGDILPEKTYPALQAGDIPEEFNPAKQWPECADVLDEVRDQSACGSCWSFGTVSAASDRWCIATNGKQKPHFSARDLLSCCSNCGYGCEGGYPSSAWSWLANTGVVTGGNFNNTEQCVSYPFPNCQHHCTGPYPDCSTMSFDTPSCQKQCDSKSSYSTSYSNDKHFFKAGYSLRGEANIQQDILKYGSVGASFSVYSDFVAYKSGIYRHQSGNYLGGHAVKIIGWGVEKGVKYWTLANSWNESWGEKGFFRMIRGTNDCGIESGINAGVPKI